MTGFEVQTGSHLQTQDDKLPTSCKFYEKQT